MYVIYNGSTGRIVSAVSDNQDINTLFMDDPEEYRASLEKVYIERIPVDVLQNIGFYLIKDGIVIKRSDNEISELQQYDKVLTEEERQLNKLKPSAAEMQKAENTIEILSLLQEVGI